MDCHLFFGENKKTKTFFVFQKDEMDRKSFEKKITKFELLKFIFQTCHNLTRSDWVYTVIFVYSIIQLVCNIRQSA